MSTQKPVILITGIAGRLGSAITAELGDAYTIVGFERKCAPAAIKCIDADISSDESVAHAFKQFRAEYGNRIASVIHLAAFYDFSGEAHPAYQSVNVTGTQNLLRGLRQFEVEQFVYASTMLVHAPSAPGVPINEDAPIAPKWPYPESKVAAESVVQAERGRIPAVILRIAGVYTDHCEVPSLATQMQRIYERQMQSRVFPGDASHGQSFVHLDDVAAAFRATVERRASLPEETAILIGEPVTESYEALQNLMGRLIHGEPWPTRQIPKPIAATGAWLQDKMEDVIPDAIDRGIEPFIKPFMVALADDHYELDISRARELLDWNPQHRLRRRLPIMVGELRSDPAGWYKRNKIPLPVWLEDAPDVGAPSPSMIAQYHALDRFEHQQTVWCHFTNVALGVWLMTSPFVLGLAQNWGMAGELIAPNGRGLVLSDTYMTASDIITGLLIVIFALFSLARDFGWARWITAGLGTWVLFAPVLFWTTSPAAYENNTIIGALVVVFALAIPPAPGMNPIARVTGPDAPPGWDYTPSGRTNRLPIIALAFVGLFISRYLTAYQLGHIDTVWDPFFGDGTAIIITSAVSEAWPVSDAGLGGIVYVLEILTGVIGDKRRWRTMPWMVLLFGVLIVPLGAVSIFFIIIQPIVIGTWCTLCLVAALAMLLQIPYSLDEILASLQFLRNRRRQGKPLWHTLFQGDTIAGGSADYSDHFEQPAGAVLRECLLHGVTVPWTLVASALIGAALMFTRLIFGTVGTAANNDHLIGALVISFSVMALSEAGRPIRLVNVLLGAWLIIAPLFMDGYSGVAVVASIAAGGLLIWLAIPTGRQISHYGAWDRIGRFKPVRSEILRAWRA